MARDLGVFIDSSDLSLQTNVNRTVSRCCNMLRQLRNIRRQVPTAVLQSLVVALVLSRLDYRVQPQCADWAACQLDVSSSVGSERGCMAHILDTVLRARYRRTHQPPLALRSGRILFKITVTTYRALNGCAPAYLSSLHPYH